MVRKIFGLNILQSKIFSIRFNVLEVYIDVNTQQHVLPSFFLSFFISHSESSTASALVA